MKLKNILIIAALASIPFVTPATLAQNQICPQLAVVAPSRQTKIIRQEKFAYSVKIPNNYKTMSLHSSELLIFDPNTFTLTQCLIKSKAAREFPEHISIYAKAVNSKNRDLAYLVRQENPGGIEKVENTKVANQAAISYTANTLGFQKSVSFFTPDRKNIITVSAPFNIKQGRPTTIFNQKVFAQVLSSFTFTRR
ncbi:hypothetical protein Cylst_0640 [Cylindrospermum stagnale PCC 7417]|uniref:Uncharacterized protein n=1 Tax=Cylindrospermum stagnale PCC 7417 TaxID=56107 RepID=K9WT62_9NOST|nr:hypothetical protein [Cylindrospermum stagnale]AFZ22971.1 hypothetical protein Cylst_0640 [Cylindrospermum stagnale PCC 7417]